MSTQAVLGSPLLQVLERSTRQAPAASHLVLVSTQAAPVNPSPQAPVRYSHRVPEAPQYTHRALVPALHLSPLAPKYSEEWRSVTLLSRCEELDGSMHVPEPRQCLSGPRVVGFIWLFAKIRLIYTLVSS